MKALLVLLAISAHGAALAGDADLLRCRAIADPLVRVQCYDAIQVATAPAGRSDTSTAPVAAPTATAAAPAPAPTAAAAAATAATAGSTPADAEATFGLSASQMRKSDAPNAITSTVKGTLEGWGPNTTFYLANGQVWRVADDSSGWFDPKTNPRVMLTRNAIGSIFFEVEGTRQAPRVRRVQ